ncbi:hypothetical protein I6E50_13995 [Roseburia hominis]|uniref:hypothetical protein n=1 Tax=Roseburia hominis TaxID=301301 RepID=UPI001F434607|nr:hypothetical protein [Roseburia hominis]
MNRIEVDIPKEVTIVAGPIPGREAYKLCKDMIDIDDVNMLCFSEHVSRIIGSFFTGFFEELCKDMTTGEIKEHFCFDENMKCFESAKDAFEKYTQNY